MRISMRHVVKALQRRGGRRLWNWLKTSEGRWFLALLGATLLAQLYLAPRWMITKDLTAYAYWGQTLDGHFLHFYSAAAKGNGALAVAPEYPPLGVYIFGFFNALYVLAAHLVGVRPLTTVMVSHVLRIFLKLPIIASHLGVVCIIFSIARQRLKAPVAWLVTATYAFAPAMFIDELGWGQTDTLILLPMLAAIWLALKGRSTLAGIMIGLAFMVKPQLIILVPLIAIYLLRWHGWRALANAVAGMFATAFLLWLPYLLPPHPEIETWYTVFHATTNVFQTGAVVDAFNYWWLVQAQQHSATTSIWHHLSPLAIGLAVFGVIMLLSITYVLLDSSPASLWIGSAAVTLVSFDMMTGQFERYVFPTVAFFLIAALYAYRYFLVYAVLYFTAFVGMIIPVIACTCVVFDLGVGDLTAWQQQVSQKLWSVSADIAWLNSAMLVVTFFFLISLINNRMSANDISEVDTQIVRTPRLPEMEITQPRPRVRASAQ